jgi:hypothetical protein
LILDEDWFFRFCRGMTPDLGVRACVRTLSPPNPDIFTAIPKDPEDWSLRFAVIIPKISKST